MAEISDIFPSSLSAPGRWSFDGSYEVHDGWLGISGEGDSIAEAVRVAVEENPDCEEAFQHHNWIIDSLSFNGSPIKEVADKSHAEAERALLGFCAYGSADEMEALIRRCQAGFAAKRKADALVNELIELLIKAHD
jgi:hypothetical protein